MVMNILKTGLYYIRLNDTALMDSEMQVFTMDELYTLAENAYVDIVKAKKDAEKYGGTVVQACFVEEKEGE